MSGQRCINRNILECKVRYDGNSEKLRESINRNILECKDYFALRRNGKVFVLIETYWNVKGNISRKKQQIQTVLIETYWNVKFETAITAAGQIVVLIETYWNVKEGRKDL